MNRLVEIFCDVDDFCKAFIPQWERQRIEDGTRKRKRNCNMYPSEIMTIIIAFHNSNYRCFKVFYTEFIQCYYRKEFPALLSYTRFVEMIPTVFIPLCSYFNQVKGKATGIQFIDSTAIKVCHNLRINRHKVFARVAQRGKTTTGWFYGFKLHFTINHIGEILSAKLTPGNVDDRIPVPELAKGLTGQLYGDKGYISKKLVASLAEKGINLVTGTRKNMKEKALSAWDNLILKKRFIIETVNDQLKNISQIEHTRHRSVQNFMVNIMGGLIAYCLKEKKPLVKITTLEATLLTA